MLTNLQLRERTGMRIRDFIIKGSQNFKFWAESLFRGSHNFEITPFHMQWFKAYLNEKRVAIISFRGSCKTTICGVLIPLYLSFYESNLTFLNVSPTMRQSTTIIAQIRRLINSVELLQYLIPRDRGYSWTKTEINTTTGCKIVCTPYSEKARTYHVNYLLMDEAQDFTETETFSSVFLPMVQHHNGNVIIIGTPKTETDLLAKVQLPNSGYKVIRCPVKDPVTDKPLWQSKFNNEVIERIRRDLGPVAFAREYMLEIRGTEGQLIPQECILNSLDTNYKLRNTGTEGGEYYIGVDLATSPTGDYTVIAVIEKTKGNQIILTHLERHRGRTAQNQAEIIANVYNRFKPVSGYIDISVVGPAILNELQTSFGINLQPFKFDPINRNNLFNNLAMVFGYYDEKAKKVMDQNIIIPRDTKDPYTMKMTDILIKELNSIYPSTTKTGLPSFKTTSKHDDCIIALGLAIQSATKMKSPEIYAAKIQPSAKPGSENTVEDIKTPSEYDPFYAKSF